MYNDFLWKKAYVLEFYKNTILQDAFAFSVPPQSEEFIYPQRIAETKTFSNVVFDDYGNDSIKINLSGTTINEELKYIYRGKLPHRSLTGTEEIFYLKDLVEKYGKQENLKDKKVVCYCLDNSTKEVKYFDVVINELKIHRSKENPMAYFYNLQMTSFPKKKKEPELWGWVSKLEEKIKSIKESIADIEEQLSFFADIRKSIKDNLSSLNKNIDDFSDVMLKAVTALFGVGEDITGIVKEITSFGDKILSSAQRITLGMSAEMYNSILNVKDDINSLVGNLIDFPEDEVPQQMMELYQKDAWEIKDILVYKGREIQNEVNEMESETKRNGNSWDYTILPGDSETDDKSIIVYSFKEKTIKEGETFDSIALEFYGDPSLGVLIQMFNKTESIKPGDTIFLPILDRTENVAANNQVFNEPNNRDVYGTDINFLSNMSFINNDFNTIKKADNLDQAIASRLTTILNSRVRDVVYGIKSEVGNSTMSSNYVLASIRNTLEEEPRIKEIENISFYSENGGLNIQIDYRDINDFSRTWGGTV